MSGQAEGTIAALLRHSTTSLVRRYAHLSPTHLKAAIETVASFGKPSVIHVESGPPKAEQPPVSNGTVTRTVIVETPKKGSGLEVVGIVGAGDGI